MKILVLLFFSACSIHELQVNGSPADNIDVVSHKKYSELKGAGDILRNVSGATLIVTFKQTGNQETHQDLMAFSVGGDGKKSSSSRASLRIEKGGQLAGIARSLDTEKAQTVRSTQKITRNETHVAALVVDYTSSEMKLYLDGSLLETQGTVSFQSKTTSDTTSISVSLGSEDDGSDFFFEGEIKDPMIWSRKLGPDVIKLYSKR